MALTLFLLKLEANVIADEHDALNTGLVLGNERFRREVYCLPFFKA